MANRIPLEELNHQLNTALGRVDAWSKDSISQASKLKHEFKENQIVNRAKQSELDAELDKYQKQANAVQERLSNEKQAEEQAKEATNNAVEEADRAQTCWQDMQSNIQNRSAKIAEHETSLLEKLENAESNLEGLRVTLQLYEERLGLRLAESEELPEELLLVFTSISQKEPQKEYTLGVQVHGGSGFEVTKCIPPVEKLETEVEELQKSADFGQFVKRMRAHFCGLAQA